MRGGNILDPSTKTSNTIRPEEIASHPPSTFDIVRTRDQPSSFDARDSNMTAQLTDHNMMSPHQQSTINAAAGPLETPSALSSSHAPVLHNTIVTKHSRAADAAATAPTPNMGAYRTLESELVSKMEQSMRVITDKFEKDLNDLRLRFGIVVH